MDLGTARVEDLFMTNANYEPIQATFYQTIFEDLESIYTQEEPIRVEDSPEPIPVKEYVEEIKVEDRKKSLGRGWDSC
jgi:hypothetical protein